MNVLSLLRFGLLALLLCGNCVRAAQSYDNCAGFITSLPATISTQGVWCMKQDLNTAITSGVAIDITTNNVVIDCNDYKLGGLAAGAGTSTIGIHADSRLNITVRHCNVRGFWMGVFLKASSGVGGGHVVEDNRFDHNTYVAAKVEGDGSTIRRNLVTDTGGTTGVSKTAEGFDTFYNVDVLDNRISGIAPTSGSNADGWGIYASFNTSGLIAGNAIGGLVHDGTGIVTAIQMGPSSSYAVLRDNSLVGDGSTGSLGVTCSSSASTTKDNVTSSFATGITGCTDGGGNFNNP